ncbi:MAG TPA: enoyl-CoA hydratase-related protein [Acidimicrobiia bacterium]|nr:enoyl-CoA hydratase-related protein [Acidimicrobiia bacterium]
MTDLVTVEWGQVALLRLTNPPLNLVTLELTAQLEIALGELVHATEVRAVVVAGNARAFCAGSDIKEFEALHGRVGEGKLLREGAVYQALAELPMPTIAAIEGNALGGGLELALCCDLRVAAESALLGLPEVSLGAIPGSGGTQRLTRLVGPGWAKRLILTGDPVDSALAHQIGLVEYVSARGEAEAVALEIAGTVASRGPLAVREAKRLIDVAVDRPLAEGLTAELAASERVFSSEDLLEGARAFAGKRPPRFSGL